MKPQAAAAMKVVPRAQRERPGPAAQWEETAVAPLAEKAGEQRATAELLVEALVVRARAAAQEGWQEGWQEPKRALEGLHRVFALHKCSGPILCLLQGPRGAPVKSWRTFGGKPRAPCGLRVRECSYSHSSRAAELTARFVGSCLRAPSTLG